jgi:hypothetical protein
LFQIHHRSKSKWKPSPARADGSQRSKVLDRWYRLEQHAEPGGVWTYDLVESEYPPLSLESVRPASNILTSAPPRPDPATDRS